MLINILWNSSEVIRRFLIQADVIEFIVMNKLMKKDFTAIQL